jgi:hypothetical protein
MSVSLQPRKYFLNVIVLKINIYLSINCIYKLLFTLLINVLLRLHFRSITFFELQAASLAAGD